ncbi:Bromodomain-containing protein [Gloeophyllum trabeum ATCC 11539]|uniref:Bromodomain-containing protein n=1 Tax=Gloeophyllum trabeum (strain ATCC 11539 / FP-39264 / Madison 617) TaxID=670483 RepID=S7QLY6_GLOTA|nr:Bromodomain-containing protein [Gloeophyllum trabeum ATCC 11539]EPQ60463.1 Bromodomain-containing protein [Gloeophyllum trabeum ATCC 11539]
MKRELGAIAGADVNPDAPRAKRRKDVPAAASPSENHASGAGAVAEASGSASDNKETSESVKEQGMQLWQTIKDAVNKEGRVLSVDFMRLPSKRQYPDYYKLIKKPISLDEIKAQLQNGGYHSLESVKQDLEMVFHNAKRYNMKDSQIWKDAKTLHKLVKKEYARMTGTKEEDTGEAGEKEHDAAGEGSDNEGDKKSKGKTPNMNRLLKSRLQKLVEKTDDSGRVLSEEFMELPNKKQWAVYYKTIKRPQCLENIFKRLKRKEYHNSADFARDVELVFANALEFNQEHTPIWEDALVLRDYFRKLMSDLPPPFALPEYAAPTKSAPAQSSGKIKLKMPAAPQPQLAPAPGPSSEAEQTSPKLTLRAPQPPAGSASQLNQAQAADTIAAEVKSPAMGSLVHIAPSVPPGTAPPKAPAAHPVQPQAAPNNTAGPSTAVATHAPSYSVHYPNAMYHQPTTPAPPAIAPAPPITVTTAPPDQTPQKASSIAKSPAPTPSRPRRQLTHVSIITNPTTRRMDLDVEDGVKSWAMRLTNGEKVVTIKDVTFLEDEHEQEEDKPPEQEQSEPATDTKGKGRAKAAAKKTEATPVDAKVKANGKPSKGIEAVEVRLNGSLVRSMSGTEWQADLPVGASTLEIGEQGGIIWKVYFDRPPL